jgi:hypothetical protein
MKKLIGLAVIGFVALGPCVADAQMRGMGRFGGTVTDESGAPLPGVTVKAVMAGGTAPITAASDDKGAWAVGGVGKGEWEVVFEKAGFAPRKAKVTLPVELARVPPIAMAMKKAS